jgi:putative peptidoglycan lipid II flippase
MAFLALGHLVAGLVLQSGAFSQQDSYWVWATLAGSTVGLLATSLGRLLTSTYYALNDQRTPLRFAVIRVVLTLSLGYLAAVHGPRLLGLDARWGTAGLTATAGAAGWVEFVLLRRGLIRQIGPFGLARSLVARLWIAAAFAAAAAWGAHALLGAGGRGTLLRSAEAAAVLLVFASAYFALALALRVPEAGTLWRRVRRGRTAAS